MTNYGSKSSNLETMGVTPKDVSKGKRRSKNDRNSRLIEEVMIGFSISLILFGFLSDTPSEIFNGIINIIRVPDYLVTDYIEVGGIGAAFVNAGLLTLIATVMLDRMKALSFRGMTLAAIFTFSGFSLFGKNVANVWPIMIGVYLYSLYKKECFSKHVYVALFGTAMSPIVTSIALADGYPLYVGIILATLAGIAIGFVFGPIASELVNYHQGFDLYNIGFASGMIGTIIVFISIAYGFEQTPRLIWSTGNNLELGAYAFLLFAVFIITAFKIEGKDVIKGYRKILTDSGRLFGYGYIEREGFAPTLLNMGVTGTFVTALVLALGAELNGPVLAGIFTVVGFSAMGKNVKNIIPIIIGVIIGALTKGMDFAEPAIVLAILFGTGLAPVTGEFGVLMGVLAGFVHSAIVLNVGVMNGGFNLYNNGFSIGLVTGFLLPIMEMLRNRRVLRLGETEHIELMQELDKNMKKREMEEQGLIVGKLNTE